MNRFTNVHIPNYFICIIHDYILPMLITSLATRRFVFANQQHRQDFACCSSLQSLECVQTAGSRPDWISIVFSIPNRQAITSVAGLLLRHLERARLFAHSVVHPQEIDFHRV